MIPLSILGTSPFLQVFIKETKFSFLDKDISGSETFKRTFSNYGEETLIDIEGTKAHGLPLGLPKPSNINLAT